MTRGRQVFWGTLAMAVVAVGGGYLAVRPKWYTSTPEAVRAALDPSLTKPFPKDPHADQRGARAATVAAEIALTRRFVLATSSTRASISPKLKELANLAAQGSLRGDPLGSHEKEAERVWPIRDVAEQLANFAASDAAPRLRGEAAVLAYRLWQAAGDATVTSAELETHFIASADFYQCLIDAARTLDEPRLAAMAKVLEPAPEGDAALQRVLRLQFQKDLLPILPKPPATVRDRLAASENTKADLESARTYDPLATARDLNVVVGTEVANAMRPRSAQDPGGERQWEAIKNSLPAPTAAGKTGWRQKWHEVLDRVALARMPNSYGRLIVMEYAKPVPERLTQSFRARTFHEAARAIVALQRYRERTGQAAPSLTALVDAGLLDDIPKDHLANKPLRYEPKRGAMWSVGDNGIDDGGPASSRWDVDDIVWFTPKSPAPNAPARA